MTGRRARLPYCLTVVVVLAVAVGAAARQSPAGAMGPEEWSVLEELNLARTRPADYASHMEDHKRSFKGAFVVLVDGVKVRTTEGLRAVDEAIGFLRSAAPAPPLSASPPLVLSAREHVRDIGQRGVIGHTGGDGSQPWERILRYGTPMRTSGEVISFGVSSARAIVVQLIVDDGIPDRGHRTNVFNPSFRVAGIAIGPHARYGRACVVNFADGMEKRAP